MRLVTVLFGSLYILNALLLFSVTAISLWLWLVVFFLWFLEIEGVVTARLD